MLLSSSEQDVIDLFWQLCGEIELFPRDLERPVALALPVALVKLPNLRLWDIERWIYQRGNTFRFDCESRRVRGCLVARAGRGLLFVDGTDPQDEQRFTIAHEIAHFMADYWMPRNKAINRFGQSVIDALDGRRPLTVAERVHALVLDVKLGMYQSLMDRSDSNTQEFAWNAEDRADRIAMALLAPPEAVLPLLDFLGRPFPERFQSTRDILHVDFGLPKEVATIYSQVLLASVGKGPSWVESLGLG